MCQRRRIVGVTQDRSPSFGLAPKRWTNPPQQKHSQADCWHISCTFLAAMLRGFYIFFATLFSCSLPAQEVFLNSSKSTDVHPSIAGRLAYLRSSFPEDSSFSPVEWPGYEVLTTRKPNIIVELENDSACAAEQPPDAYALIYSDDEHSLNPTTLEPACLGTFVLYELRARDARKASELFTKQLSGFIRDFVSAYSRISAQARMAPSRYKEWWGRKNEVREGNEVVAKFQCESWPDHSTRTCTFGDWCGVDQTERVYFFGTPLKATCLGKGNDLHVLASKQNDQVLVFRNSDEDVIRQRNLLLQEGEQRGWPVAPLIELESEVSSRQHVGGYPGCGLWDRYEVNSWSDRGEPFWQALKNLGEGGKMQAYADLTQMLRPLGLDRAQAAPTAQMPMDGQLGVYADGRARLVDVATFHDFNERNWNADARKPQPSDRQWSEWATVVCRSLRCVQAPDRPLPPTCISHVGDWTC